MNLSVSLLALLPAAVLLLFGALPTSVANRGVRHLRLWVPRVAGLQSLLALGLAIANAFGAAAGPIVAVPFGETVTESLAALGLISAYYDGVTSLMLALVSFVGWVISRYSVRYLDGESNQGRYFRWTAFTIGAVSMMVISGNLLMFLLAWIATSLGLHQLLLHYGDRPVAQSAAWTKFTISRIGDAALLVAAVIIYREFATLDFASIFAAINAETFEATPALHAAGFLIVAGAVTKSAQFPFHTWLPQTMETPTPVSALMHAGIVNAGGYLIIRMSPLVSLTPAALTWLAVVGAITTCYAAIVMSTQTSVKSTLAYSTIAQMGFMMLQCGLGAFSAAMLHIIAHSLYKAHAFLSSGSVLAERASMRGTLLKQQPVAWTSYILVGALTIAALWISLLAFGINPMLKPGGLLLSFVLCLALTSWIGQVLQAGDGRLLLQASLASAALCLVYSASFAVVDRMVSPTLSPVTPQASVWFVSLVVVLGFAGLSYLNWASKLVVRPTWFNAMWVHASNGFYMDAWLRRIFGHLASE